MPKMAPKELVVCVSNEGYPASLDPRKIYVAVPDAEARRQGMLRIIDESGEDYLYAKGLFRVVELPNTTRKAVLAA